MVLDLSQFTGCIILSKYVHLSFHLIKMGIFQKFPAVKMGPGDAGPTEGISVDAGLGESMEVDE